MFMQKVLVCISDAQFFLFLRHVLNNEGFEAALATHTVELQPHADAGDVAAVVLDVGAPGGVAGQLIDRARNWPGLVPLIVFDRSGHATRTRLRPCDLLLTRPFDPTVLIHFLRRLRFDHLAAPAKSRSDIILEFADLQMNLASMKVVRAGREVALTALQFRLLRHLLEKSSSVSDREDLIHHCWPPEAEVEPRTVDVHIGQIRRTLLKFGPDLIRTVRGYGYALGEPIDRRHGPC
jgi:two-component system, OmpR family, phosphate regulon response regulator PhoB